MEILKLREHSELASEAAEWFHSKWDIPVEEYAGSIQECLTGKSIVPQWYVAVENQQIIGGIGVIENDFHNRKDLTPNVCAVYVEENYRCQGIAGKLLEYVCEDCHNKEHHRNDKKKRYAFDEAGNLISPPIRSKFREGSTPRAGG